MIHFMTFVMLFSALVMIVVPVSWAVERRHTPLRPEFWCPSPGSIFIFWFSAIALVSAIATICIMLGTA